MNKTAMWNEVQDQVEVSRKILEVYLPQAEYFRDLLKNKKKLILTGMGASLYACQMAKYTFYQYCPLWPQVVPADELAYLLPSVTKDTLIIFISQSGESYETKEVGKLLQERGIEFWGITNNPQSSLARTASQVMLLHCDTEISSATKTNMASLLLLLIVAAGWNEKMRRHLETLPSLLESCMEQIEEPVEALASRLIHEAHTYVLGMGANAATAVEGALMLQEKTFIHTGGMAASDFRHGTVEVVEPGLQIILVSSQKENGEMAIAHGNYLKGIGAQVYLMTDQKDILTAWGGPGLMVPDIGEEAASPLMFLPPLQLLAEAVARQKGLDVDGFRHLSKVVSEYRKGENA